MATIKRILQITPFFAPNIGGVETHLSDLITALDKKNFQNLILTYSPLTTPNLKWKSKEKIGKKSFVIRFSWIAGDLFNRLEKYPFLNLLYITPYLLVRSALYLWQKKPKIDTIHSHGLNSAIIGIILKKIFKYPRHITSIYSTYDNVPFDSISTKILVWVLNHCDHVLTQSDSSVLQLIKLGVSKDKISRYYHWVDLEVFKPIKKQRKKFTVLFVGRMIAPKNAPTIAAQAKYFPNINFVFVGTGPDYQKISQLSKKFSNIKLVGNISYSKLNSYYQNSDLLCVPSKYHEGWGRIIAESISCGAPVISSNLGGTIEAADSSVAVFIKPSVNNFKKEISKLISSPAKYRQLKNNCRSYALKHYSIKNLNYITSQY